jgi:hypothetical protein
VSNAARFGRDPGSYRTRLFFFLSALYICNLAERSKLVAVFLAGKLPVKEQLREVHQKPNVLGRCALNISNQLDCHQTILSLATSSIEDSATKSCVSLPLLLHEGQFSRPPHDHEGLAHSTVNSAVMFARPSGRIADLTLPKTMT